MLNTYEENCCYGINTNNAFVLTTDEKKKTKTLNLKKKWNFKFLNKLMVWSFTYKTSNGFCLFYI